MKINLKAAIGGAAALSVVAGMMFGAASANAVAPGYEPDPNAQGTLSFYNAAGVQVTSGSITDVPFATYYAASSSAGTDTGATMSMYTAVDGTPPVGWQTGEQESSAQVISTAHTAGSTNPVGQPYPANLKPGTAPVVFDDSGVALQDHITNFPSQSTLTPNVYQIRVVSFPSGTKYWTADVQVNPANGTWTQIYPAVATTTAISAITANPVSPAPAGTTSVALSATLTAGDSTHPAGTVALFDGATNLGAATLNAATGAITGSAAVADNSSHSFTFVFTPTVPASYNGSTSPALAYNVSAPAPAANTSTVVTGNTTGTVGNPVTFTATVKSVATVGNPLPANTPVTAGSVQFKVDGVNYGAPVALGAGGIATTGYSPATVPPANHIITATFVPTNPAQFVTSSDNTGVTCVFTAALWPTDPQTFVVTVPAGTLVISTPYTPAHPFNLGTMVLNPTGTQYATTPVNFGDPAVAAAGDPGAVTTAGHTVGGVGTDANGVTITDTRAGAGGWVASVNTTDFANAGSTPINGDLLSFTNVAPKFLTGNAYTAANITTTSPGVGFKSAAKQFAQASVGAGPGTVNVVGQMSLTAPSSTTAGLYTATVTFSIV